MTTAEDELTAAAERVLSQHGPMSDASKVAQAYLAVLRDTTTVPAVKRLQQAATEFLRRHHNGIGCTEMRFALANLKGTP